MIEVKHTPGPWSIDGPNRFGCPRITAPYKPTCTYLIAEASPDCPDDATMQANARLIAAAPDLLAACEALLRFAESVRPGGGVLAGEHDMLRDARAAISKAGGAA